MLCWSKELRHILEKAMRGLQANFHLWTIAPASCLDFVIVKEHMQKQCPRYLLKLVILVAKQAPTRTALGETPAFYTIVQVVTSK